EPASEHSSRVLQRRATDRLTRRERRELEERQHPGRRRASGFATGVVHRLRGHGGVTPASRGARGALLVAFVHLRQLWRSRRHQVAAGAAVAFVYTLLGLGWAATGGSGGALLALLAFTVLTVLLVAIPMLG